MIIAVDFDGTIQLDNGQPNIELIQRLKREQRNGNIIILWTCRAGKRLAEAVVFCVENGIKPNYVNQNAPQVIARIGDPRKIFADCYIDDKAVRGR